MSSLLIITPVEKLDKKILSTLRSLGNIPVVYLSLNKPHDNVEHFLRSNKINLNKMFFIDCVASDQKKDDVLHFKPNDIEHIRKAINAYMKYIKGRKFLIIDALTTLLIYNDENKVIKFAKRISEFAAREDIEVIALSSKSTTSDALFNKIYNFFDEVKKVRK